MRFAVAVTLVELAIVIVAAACGSNNQSGTQGQLGDACYPNGTCNQGLSCESNVCVPGSGSGGQGVGVDSGKPPEDGTPCTVQSSQCDPGCQESCGSDPNCNSACCPAVDSTGVFCAGVCSPPVVVHCASGCTNTQYDNQNCGMGPSACGHACGMNQYCIQGQCQTAAMVDGG